MYYWITYISKEFTNDIYAGDDYVQAWNLFRSEWLKLTDEQQKCSDCFCLVETKTKDYDSNTCTDWKYICDLSYVNTLEKAARWLTCKMEYTDNNFPKFEMDIIIECNKWVPCQNDKFEICTFSGKMLTLTDTNKVEIKSVIF